VPFEIGANGGLQLAKLRNKEKLNHFALMEICLGKLADRNYSQNWETLEDWRHLAVWDEL